MKIITLILSLLLLTSCSNPGTSGGVTLSRGGGDDANEFPNGSCEGQHENTPDLNTGCGWIHVNEGSHYIMPGADLSYANLNRANLSGAHLHGVNLQHAYLILANLTGVDLSSAQLYLTVLVSANLTGANLEKATLREADLTDAELSGIKANSFTTCPDGKKWGTHGNDCGF